MTVHSKDRETWLTKLERIKLLASQNQGFFPTKCVNF